MPIFCAQKQPSSPSMRVKGSTCKLYDAVIVGNGPSAISLSYFLSGNWPFYNCLDIPDPLLDDRLKYCGTDISLVEQDLEELSDGLYDSRSDNPVSILFDRLNHPNADFMTEEPSALIWKNDENTVSFKHLVLGLGPPGGAWHHMTYSQYSLSLSYWLELPGFPFKTWLHDHNHRSQAANGNPCNLPRFDREEGVHEDRVLPNHVALYYSEYVKRMKLDHNFMNNVKVTSVKRAGSNNPIWEVNGLLYNGSTSEPFRVFARNVVLAVGAYSRPKTLNVTGENLKFVKYQLPDLDDFINDNDRKKIEPVVVVGCGLVALDAVLALIDKKIPVLHVFRRDAKDQKLIVNQLPSSYPDYLKLKPLMTGRSTNEFYTPLSMSKVTEILPSKECAIEHVTGKYKMIVNASLVLVQIGSRPNLSFLGDIDNLAVDSTKEVDVKENPIDVDLVTYETRQESGMYAIGPLVGDNFVRFIIGGALAITNGLVAKLKKEKK